MLPVVKQYRDVTIDFQKGYMCKPRIENNSSDGSDVKISVSVLEKPIVNIESIRKELVKYINCNRIKVVSYECIPHNLDYYELFLKDLIESDTTVIIMEDSSSFGTYRMINDKLVRENKVVINCDMELPNTVANARDIIYLPLVKGCDIRSIFDVVISKTRLQKVIICDSCIMEPEYAQLVLGILGTSHEHTTFHLCRTEEEFTSIFYNSPIKRKFPKKALNAKTEIAQ